MNIEVFHGLSPDEAFALFDTGKPLDIWWAKKKGIIFCEMQYNELIVVANKHKIECFKRSLDCACCETKGEVFQIVRNENNSNISLELFGRNLYGHLSLMTHDHINGRSHEQSNLQTLCYSCNALKADLKISIPQLREKLHKNRNKTK